MNDPVILAGVLLFLIAGIAGAFFMMGAVSTDHPSIEEFSTDRQSYRSGEEMEIRVTISSPRSMENLTLRIEGIRDRMGRPRCQILEVVTLEGGDQAYTFSYTLPECSACAGLPPGEYQLNATLSDEAGILSSMVRRIRLE